MVDTREFAQTIFDQNREIKRLRAALRWWSELSAKVAVARHQAVLKESVMSNMDDLLKSLKASVIGLRGGDWWKRNQLERSRAANEIERLQAVVDLTAKTNKRLEETCLARHEEIERLRELLAHAVYDHDADHGENNNVEHWSFRAHVVLLEDKEGSE